MSRQAGAIIGLTAVVSFLLGLVAAGTQPVRPTSRILVQPGSDAVLPLTLARPASVPVDGGSVRGPMDFAAVAERVNPAVVNVDTASSGPADRRRGTRRFSGSGELSEGSGSGFLIDPSGLILTNHHVISGAERIVVTLTDGRTFRAETVGVDPALDVALLQVDAGEPLPVVVLGNSDTLRVGEWVCAIGNPLGVYVHSVTVGVVSFLGRKLFDQNLDAFIQTDAAISFGNSGGPLINARGEVVGITTAISSQASSIGFAIPITQVIDVLPQLREHGRVARGFLGLRLTTVTPDLRRALGVRAAHGALVEDVTPETPAALAGLRPYDVIVRADGHAIETGEELNRYVSTRQPGTMTFLEVWRDDRALQVSLKLRDRPLAGAARSRTLPAGATRAEGERLPLGMTVRDLDARTIRRLLLPEHLEGVVVAAVDPAGPAHLAQLRVNHVVLEVNRRVVRNLAEYRAAVGGLRPGDTAALLVYDRTSRQRAIIPVVADPDS